MELGPAVHHSLGVLRHAAVEVRLSVIVVKDDSVEVAGAQAPAAAHAAALVHGHLPPGGVKNQALVGALLLAPAAPPAGVIVDVGLAAAVLLLLARPGAAAHANVLDGPAEAGHLVALEVGQADEDIGVHHRPADAGLLDILAAGHRHGDVVGALEPVGDDDGAAHRQGRKAVLPGALQVLQGVFPASGVHGVAVGEEGLAPQGLYHVRHGPGVVGPQKAEVPQLAEVHLDGYELAVHVNFADAGLFDELLELDGGSLAVGRYAEIGEIYLCFFHSLCTPLVR